MIRLRRGSERAKRAVVGLEEAIVVSGDRVGVACITKRPKKNILGITYYTFLRSAMHVKTDKNIFGIHSASRPIFISFLGSREWQAALFPNRAA